MILNSSLTSQHTKTLGLLVKSEKHSKRSFPFSKFETFSSRFFVAFYFWRADTNVCKLNALAILTSTIPHCSIKSRVNLTLKWKRFKLLLQVLQNWRQNFSLKLAIRFYLRQSKTVLAFSLNNFSMVSRIKVALFLTFYVLVSIITIFWGD